MSSPPTIALPQIYDENAQHYVHSVLSYAPYSQWGKIIAQVYFIQTQAFQQKPFVKRNEAVQVDEASAWSQILNELLAADSLFGPFGRREEAKMMLSKTMESIKQAKASSSPTSAEGIPSTIESLSLGLDAWFNRGDFVSAYDNFMIGLQQDKTDLFLCKKAQLMALLGGFNEKIIEPCELIKDFDNNLAKDYVPGMMVFGYEQIGEYKKAEEAAMIGINAGLTDGWLDHGYAHSLYFQGKGRVPEALSFLKKRSKSWTLSNTCFFLYSHLWWHYALVLLENNEISQALEIYDSKLFPTEVMEEKARAASAMSEEEEEAKGYLNDLQVQLNAMELLWKLKAKDETAFQSEGVQRWHKLIEHPKKIMTEHRDFLHSMLLLQGLVVLEDKHGIELFFQSLERLSVSDDRKDMFRDICDCVLRISSKNTSEEGRQKARERLRSLQPHWTVVGNS